MDYKIIAAAALMSVVHINTSGQAFSEKRTYLKTVPVTRDVILEVNNKYGSIQITSWMKDSISVRAEIEAFAPSQSRIRKMLEGVSVNITESRYKVVAQTDFTKTINMLFESFKGMTSKLIPYESRVQINYYINIPEYLSVNLENKYGDVYMENNTAKMNISLSNGSFRANSIARVTGLRLTFCDATINYLGEGSINSSFSEISIGESGNLNIESTSSRFDLRNTGNITTESRRDKFFIGSVSSIKGNSYFTDFSIERLDATIDLTARYGSFISDEISRNFELIAINSGFCDVNLSFDELSSYNLDLKYTNAFVTLPGHSDSFDRKAVNEEKKEYMVYGIVGKNPASRKVRIDANRGSILIK